MIWTILAQLYSTLLELLHPLTLIGRCRLRRNKRHRCAGFQVQNWVEPGCSVNGCTGEHQICTGR